jgi:N-acyl amino acid synthase of PEP-CTERM/exosortase system
MTYFKPDSDIIQPGPASRKPGLYEFYNSIFEGFVADTDDLRQECYRIRYQVYCIEYDWLNESNRYAKDAIERDEYDDHSVHALLRHRPTGAFVGTVRLIRHFAASNVGMSPIHKLCAANNLTLPQLFPLENMAEISRFCIRRDFRRRIMETIASSGYTKEELENDKARIVPSMSLGLIAMIVLMAKQNGIKQWCAEMEPFLLCMLAKLGIHFDPVGPLIEYHGMRQICHKPLHEWLNRIAVERPDVWEVVTDKGRYCGQGEHCS